jgi:hypothetical protein
MRFSAHHALLRLIFITIKANARKNTAIRDSIAAAVNTSSPVPANTDMNPTLDHLVSMPPLMNLTQSGMEAIG